MTPHYPFLCNNQSGFHLSALATRGCVVLSAGIGAVLRVVAGALSLIVLPAAVLAQNSLGGPVAITPPSVITGTVNAPYLYVVSATGGTGEKTFTVTAGTLPPGLAVTAGGTVFGAPSIPGTYQFTLTAADPQGATASRAFVINILGHAVVARTPTVTAITSSTATLGGNVTVDGFPSLVMRGVAYARAAANANPFPLGNEVTTATSLGTTGAFTINAAGLVPGSTYSYRAFATNSMGTVYSAVGTFTTLEPGQFAITTVTLPNPGLNASGYRQSIATTGGTGDYHFSVTAGALPPGMILGLDGSLSGAATTAGTYTFTVSATDAQGAIDARAFTLVVGPPRHLEGGAGSLPNPGLNVPGYSHPLVAIGGTGNYTFTLVTGSLPPGLALTRDGTISGTATATGSYPFAVSISDAAGAVVSRLYTLVVAAPVPITVATSLRSSYTLGGGPFAASFVAGGGTGPYTFFVSGGALPPGLALTTGGVFSGVPTAAGTYTFTIVATDSLGATGSLARTLVVQPGALATQAITFGAVADRFTTDAPFTLSATASSGLPVSYTVSGPARISGATLTLTGQPGPVLITAAQAGNATFAAAPPVSQSFTVTLPTDRLINLSARVRVAPDPSRALIAGFVIGGAQSKRVLVRAIGPTLPAFGVTGALVDPRLQIFDATGAVVRENDNWSGADTAAATAQVNAFPLAAGSRDAALLATLPPGSYTMQLSAGAETGIGLAEVYDASDNPGAEAQRLVNISTRGMVEAGDGVLIGGFVISGGTPKKILVRGIGPRLAVFGVEGTLADPRLAVYSGQIAIAQNDNWSTPQTINAAQPPATASELTATALAVGAFALGTESLDAAVLVTLPPGAYTAQVAGAGTTSGVALVEIYEVP